MGAKKNRAQAQTGLHAVRKRATWDHAGKGGLGPLKESKIHRKKTHHDQDQGRRGQDQNDQDQEQEQGSWEPGTLSRRSAVADVYMYIYIPCSIYRVFTSDLHRRYI